jgi:hypothetical protein
MPSVYNTAGCFNLKKWVMDHHATHETLDESQVVSLLDELKRHLTPLPKRQLIREPGPIVPKSDSIAMEVFLQQDAVYTDPYCCEISFDRPGRCKILVGVLGTPTLYVEVFDTASGSPTQTPLWTFTGNNQNSMTSLLDDSLILWDRSPA